MVHFLVKSYRHVLNSSGKYLLYILIKFVPTICVPYRDATYDNHNIIVATSTSEREVCLQIKSVRLHNRHLFN